MNIQSFNQNQPAQQNFGALKFREFNCTSFFTHSQSELPKIGKAQHPTAQKVWRKIVNAQDHPVHVIITGYQGDEFVLAKGDQEIGKVRKLDMSSPQAYLENICTALDEAWKMQ